MAYKLGVSKCKPKSSHNGENTNIKVEFDSKEVFDFLQEDDALKYLVNDRGESYNEDK